MFWAGGELSRKLPNIISAFDEKRIDCASYTLTLGMEVYISPDGQLNKLQHPRLLKQGEAFEIPPGQFAFLLTQEVLNIPNDVLALINVKSGIKLQGLVNVSGFHVDPGYHGRLVVSVINVGSKSIVMKQGDPCFLIWFSSTVGEVAKHHKTGQGYMSIDSKLVSGVPRRNVSLLSLEREVERLQGQVKNLLYAAAIVIPVVLAALVATFQVILQRWLG